MGDRIDHTESCFDAHKSSAFSDYRDDGSTETDVVESEDQFRNPTVSGKLWYEITIFTLFVF